MICYKSCGPGDIRPGGEWSERSMKDSLGLTKADYKRLKFQQKLGWIPAMRF